MTERKDPREKSGPGSTSGAPGVAVTPLPDPPNVVAPPSNPLGGLTALAPLPPSVRSLGVGRVRVDELDDSPLGPDRSSQPEVTSVEVPASRVRRGVAREPTPRAGGASEEAPSGEVCERANTGEWVIPESRTGDQAPPSDERLVGGRYRIESDLGEGGMARIFRVSHVGMGRELALKIINADLAADPRMRKHFEREARVLSQLEHPHVVQITDFGVDEKLGAYIVMEYVRGETLLERLRRDQRLPPSLALDIAIQVADAVSYIHQRDLVHCDIKAENVLLVPGSVAQRRRLVVKLIDFGLSRSRARNAQLSKSEIGGTPQYMAPEQIRGTAPTPAMDIYALGVLIFEMLTGRLPFRGELKDVLRGHLGEAPPLPSSVSPQPLDKSLETLVLKALSKDPAARQQSMGHLIFELRTVMDMLGFGRRRSVVSIPQVDPERPAVSAHTHCDACPFPIFRVDERLRIVMANPAFMRFVKVNAAKLMGTAIHDTRLRAIYPTLRAELRGALQDGQMIQRVLRFEPSGRSPVSVMASLVPERSVDGYARSIYGLIVPLQSEAFSCVEEE